MAVLILLYYFLFSYNSTVCFQSQRILFFLLWGLFHTRFFLINENHPYVACCLQQRERISNVTYKNNDPLISPPHLLCVFFRMLVPALNLLCVITQFTYAQGLFPNINPTCPLYWTVILYYYIHFNMILFRICIVKHSTLSDKWFSCSTTKKEMDGKLLK